MKALLKGKNEYVDRRCRITVRQELSFKHRHSKKLTG